MKFPLPLTMLLALLTAPQKPVPAPLAKHVETLNNAETLRARFTVRRGTFAPEEHALVYSRRGGLKVESASELLLSDGTKVIRFDKQKNEYTEGEVGVAGGAESQARGGQLRRHP